MNAQPERNSTGIFIIPGPNPRQHGLIFRLINLVLYLAQARLPSRASQLVTTPGYGFPANPTKIIKYLPLLSLYQANGQKSSTPSSLPTCAADDRAWHRKLPFNSLRRKSEQSSIGELFLSSARLCFCFPPFDLHLDKIVAGRYD